MKKMGPCSRVPAGRARLRRPYLQRRRAEGPKVTSAMFRTLYTQPGHCRVAVSTAKGHVSQLGVFKTDTGARARALASLNSSLSPTTTQVLDGVAAT